MAVSPNTVTSADVQNFIIDGGGGGADVGAPWRDIIGLEEAPSVGDTLPSPHDTVMG